MVSRWGRQKAYLRATCSHCGLALAEEERECFECAEHLNGRLHPLCLGALVFISLFVVGFLLKLSTHKQDFENFISAHLADEYKLPEQELSFIQQVTASRFEYRRAFGEGFLGEIREERAQKFQELLPNREVEQWRGRVEAVTYEQGHGYHLSLRIAPNIHLSTIENYTSEVNSHGLIDQDHPLFARMEMLSQGEEIEFSGRFYPSNKNFLAVHDCTSVKSIDYPEFLFRFSDLKQLAKKAP